MMSTHPLSPSYSSNLSSATELRRHTIMAVTGTTRKRDGAKLYKLKQGKKVYMENQALEMTLLVFIKGTSQ